MNKDSNIAILGYGIEGRSTEAYLKRQGYTRITVLDEKEDPSAFADLSPYDHIFRSPGVPLHRFSKYKDKLTSLTRYFFENCPCPILGVTGTKGKGTASTLLFKMLQKDGKDAHLGGNIGDPPLDFLDELSPESLVVLELSSFQLEDLSQSPHLAIILGITEDHLDYHPTREAYRSAKEPILKFQTPEDHAIINADYEGSRPFAKLGEGQKHYVSRQDAVEGAFMQDEDLMILGEKLATKTDVALRGDHNLENALPACLAAKLMGASNEAILAALQEFKGLPHRLEFVCEKNGIQFFNDSFSTTPETSIAGLRSFTEPLYLIAGGSEKHSDFTEWGKACASSKNLKKVLLIGETAARLEAALPNGTPYEHVKNLEGAFSLVGKEGKPGDVLLLSPACASFDQFENYKKRGEVFREMATKQG